MSLDSLLNQPVVLVYVDTDDDDKDAHGQPTAEPTTTTSRGYAREREASADRAVSQAHIEKTLYLLPDAVAEHLAFVEVNGDTYAVDGLIHLQWSPRTQRYEFLVVPICREV